MSIQDKLAALERSPKSIEEYCRENNAEPMPAYRKVALERPLTKPPSNEWTLYADGIQLDTEKTIALFHNGLIAIAECKRSEGYAKISEFGYVWAEKFTGHPVKLRRQMIDYSGMTQPE